MGPVEIIATASFTNLELRLGIASEPRRFRFPGASGFKLLFCFQRDETSGSPTQLNRAANASERSWAFAAINGAATVRERSVPLRVWSCHQPQATQGIKTPGFLTERS